MFLFAFFNVLYMLVTTITIVLRPFVQDYAGESVPDGKTILDFTEADMLGWQWHQLNHVLAICTSLQKITTPAPHHSDFYGPDALPDTQPTSSKRCRQKALKAKVIGHRSTYRSCL